GVVPVKVGVEAAGLAVYLEVNGFDIDHSFEHVQAWPGTVQAAVVPLRPLLGDLACQARPGVPTGAGIDAAGLFQAQLVDQFAADLTEGGALHEQVTPPEHPDIALGRSEGNRLGQLCRAGVTSAQLDG